MDRAKAVFFDFKHSKSRSCHFHSNRTTELEMAWIATRLGWSRIVPRRWHVCKAAVKRQRVTIQLWARNQPSAVRMSFRCATGPSKQVTNSISGRRYWTNWEACFNFSFGNQPAYLLTCAASCGLSQLDIPKFTMSQNGRATPDKAGSGLLWWKDGRW